MIEPPVPADSIVIPGSRAFLRDVLGILPATTGLLAGRQIPSVDGNGAPVMLLPGYGSGPIYMRPLKRRLSKARFNCDDWGLGRNHGNVGALLPQVIDNVLRLSDQHGTAISLVGWSLGGYLAREAARDLPDEIDRVVTFGTPAWGGPKYTVTANWYADSAHATDAIEQATLERFKIPINQPITAIYSKRDGVVAWPCCIDHWSPDVTHIEVPTTHLAMGFDRTVMNLVVKALAEKPTAS